ncbi:MAG TPA: ComEC/Rec2 family competence protein [Lacunisphaera sp.]|nr:ComEC/Rec2 family competence protein [Lacunisphaera sp.]
MPSPALQLRAPLLWLLLPFVIGLIVARHCPVPTFGLWPATATAGVTALAALAAAWFQRNEWWTISLALAAGFGGFVLLHLRYPGLHDWSTRPPREITVTVNIVQVFPTAPKARNLSGIAIIVATDDNNRELLGRRIYYSAIRRISVPPLRSARYLLRGVIEPLPRETGAAGFNDYLANLGIHHRLTRAHVQREIAAPGRFQRFCVAAEARLESILQEGLAAHPGTLSLYVGMLLGQKAVLSSEQQDAFTRSGTFHIFSISGLHVGVIAGALQGLLQLLRVGGRMGMAITLAVLWLYVEITGAGSPAVRAFLMVAFLLASRAFRLPGNALAALVASALATLLFDPLQLFSTGFQMSYGVVTALVVMGRPLTEHWLARWRPFALLPRINWRWWHRALEWCGRQAITGMAGCWVAFLASTPSGIGYFGVFSLGSLPANLVIIPLTSLAIMAGFLSLLCGLAGMVAFSALFNSAAAIILLATDWVLQRGIALPGMFFPAGFRTEWLASASLGLMTATMVAGAAGGWSRRYGGYWPPAVLLGLLLIFGVKFG